MSPMPRLVGTARALVAPCLMATTVVLQGCAPSVDVKDALKVTDVVTGWYDAGIVEGRKNKLVPSVTFRVQNTSSTPVTYVQLNAVFRVIGDQQELGSRLVRGIGDPGLGPGQFSEAFTLQSDLGYTGEQPRVEMLQHSEFKDAQVEVFAKHGSDQWVKLDQFKIDRTLLAPR